MSENVGDMPEKHAMGPVDDRLPVHPDDAPLRETSARIQTSGSSASWFWKYQNVLKALKYDPMEDRWWMSGEDGARIFGEKR